MKKGDWKKLLAASLATVMTVGLLAGCGDTSGGGQLR